VIHINNLHEEHSLSTLVEKYTEKHKFKRKHVKSGKYNEENMEEKEHTPRNGKGPLIQKSPPTTPDARSFAFFSWIFLTCNIHSSNMC
jgi:hypothetical protein